MPLDAIPAGYHCVACGYDAGGLPGYVCPECAEPVSDEALLAWGARRRWAAQRMVVRRWIAAAAVVCIVYGAGAGLFEGGMTMLGSIAALMLACYGSLAMGALCAAAAQVPNRAAVRSIWLRHLWILHLPWLVVGPVALLLALIAGLETLAAVDLGALVMMVAVFVLPMWAILVVLVNVAWLRCAQDDMVHAMLRERIAGAAMAVCALAVVATAASLGAIGGEMAARWWRG